MTIPTKEAKMTPFLIEPRDPLIARDGRPSALGRFESLDFPLPSTIAGATRTRMAAAEGAFDLGQEDTARLLGLAVHGPLLARLAGEGVANFFAPAPRDAVVIQSQDGARRYRLAPRALPPGCSCDAEGKLESLTFAAGGWQRTLNEKATMAAPAFWSWATFEDWLTNPKDEGDFAGHHEGLGHLPREARAHLAIEPGERIGKEGALFATEGLRFLSSFGDRGKLDPLRLGLYCRAEEDAAGEKIGKPLALREELAPIGGERRLARWRPQAEPWPELPRVIRENVTKTRRARLILLTPAIFAAGALPGWNDAGFPGQPAVRVRVKAAALPRAQVVSGWDLREQKPKPTRRLVAAGSVYFVELDGDEADIGAWCESVWLRPVSDHEQDRRDGFGLAALGIWPKAEEKE